MDWICLVFGMVVGFVIGILSSKTTTSQQEGFLTKIADKLDMGQSLCFSFHVGKSDDSDDDDFGNDEDEDPEPEFRISDHRLN